MKKIFLHCFFLSWIFTLQAQITPDGGTNTQVNSQNGVELIDIATPNTSGLSNNSYSEFNVSSSGIILNNSGGTSASQLTGGNISGNSNITAGNQASLILNQITGNNTSLLEGKTEVVGTKAEVIIANPNGITCSGCGFINASQLSLITGTSQWDSSNNLTHFNIDNNGKIIVNGTGLDAEEVDVLNLVSRYHEITAEIKAKDKLRILAGNHTYNLQNFTLDSSTGIENNSGNLSIDISALGGLKSGSIELVSSEENLNVNYTANTTANNLNITVTGDLSFSNNNIIANILNIKVNDFLGVYLNISSDSLNIAADSLTITDLYGILSNINTNTSTIISNNFYNSGGSFGGNTIDIITYNDFTNSAYIGAKNLSVTAKNNFKNYGVIRTDRLDIITKKFYNVGNSPNPPFLICPGSCPPNPDANIIANTLNIISDEFRNYYATISADNLNISYNYLYNTEIIISGNARYFGNVFIENVNNLPIVPDGTSSTDAIQSSSGIDIINIARPDSNGLSNNSYSDFSISSSGLVFNNSASAVSSSLAGTIAGNPNYSALDSASLILNQITSNNASYLGGMLEVAGDSATIIIANPNGIVCDGCSFANTDKVDLITGTANLDAAGLISGYSTETSDIYIYKANIFVKDFNAIVGDNFLNYVSTIDTDNFNVTTGLDFYNRDNATISADNFNVTAGGTFYNRDSATINANIFNVTAGDDFRNWYDSTINADNLNVTAGGYFSNSSNAPITANNFNITADSFQNYAIINADNFNVTAGRDFDNQRKATISADNFNVTAGDDFKNENSATINTHNFNVTVGGFFNYDNAIINANNLTISADSFTNTDRYGDGSITADTFSLSIAGDFDYANDFLNNGNIDATALNFQVGGDFSYNDASNDFVWNAGDNLVVLGSAFITADNYTQSGAIDVIGDLIIQVSTEASLDAYSSIQANHLVFQTGNNLYNQADIITNEATFDIQGTFYNYNNTINTDNLFILADSFYNGGTMINGNSRFWFSGGIINANSFNATIKNLFLNSSPHSSAINTNNLNITTNSFRNDQTIINSNNINITADNFSSYAGGMIAINDINIVSKSFINYSYSNDPSVDLYNKLGNIYAKNLNISSESSFYNQRGNISADSFTAIVGGNFYNERNSKIIVDNFSVTADNFFNRRGGDFYICCPSNTANYENSTISADNINVTTINNFDNSGDIYSNSLNITTNNFTNTDSYGDGNIIADTLTLSVVGDFDYRNIDATSFNLNIGGNFTYIDTNNDFVLNENDSLVVLGSAFVTADNYTQSGVIDIAGDLSIQVTNEASLDDTASIQSRNLFFSAYDFYNQADITITDNATFDIGNDFNNGFYLDGYQDGGDIITNNFHVTAGNNFYNRRNGTINANNFNVTTGEYFSNYKATINANIFNVTTSNFSNRYRTINADSFSVSLSGSVSVYGDFWNDGTINADSFSVSLSGSVSVYGDFWNDGTINADSFSVSISGDNGDFWNDGATINADNFSVSISGDNSYFENRNHATINADSFSVSISGDNSYFENSYTASIRANNFNVSLYGDDGEFRNGHNQFINYDNTSISADNFSVSLSGDNVNFWNRNNASISADNFSVNLTGDKGVFINSNASISADSFSVSISGDNSDFRNGYFSNYDGASINADNFSVSVSGDNSDFLNGNGANISADNFSVSLFGGGGYFSNSDRASINADSFSVSVSGDNSFFSNYGSIITNSFSVSIYGDRGKTCCTSCCTYGFYNSRSITADKFNVNVYGVGKEFLNTHSANINANEFSVNLSGDNSDFVNERFANISTDSFFVRADNFLNTAFIVTSTYDIRVNNINKGAIFFNSDALAGTGSTDVVNVNGIDIIQIAKPNNKGLSYNTFSDFNISSSGAVFNNSYSSGTSQLAGTILGNPNYSSSDSASIILNQITSNNTTTLAGTLEVFGSPAEVIIANPNGIHCSGCSVFNSSELKLVTGNYNSIGVLDSIATSGILIDGNGLNGDLATIDIHTTGSFSNRANIDAKNFLVEARNFLNSTSISADNFSVSLYGDNSYFWNVQEANINANNFSVSLYGNNSYFENSYAANINANNFNVSAGDSFSNRYSATINANIFNVTTSNFSNRYSATINANSFNVYGDNDGYFTNWTASINANNFNVSLSNDNGKFVNAGSVTTDNFNVSLYGDGGKFINHASISADSFNVSLYGDNSYFENSYFASISADSFNASLYGDNSYFENSENINANHFNVSVASGNFNNTHLTLGDGNISAYSLSLSVAGDFDYSSDFLNNGNIDATTQYFIIRNGNFTNNTSIALAGNLGITADNFINTGGSITADTFDLSVAGDFDYRNIDATSFNLNIGGNFTYNDTNNSFVLNSTDKLVAGTVSIDAFSFDNAGSITADSFSLSVARDFDYRNIDATSFNLNIRGNFTYNDTSNSFVLNSTDKLVAGTVSIDAFSFDNQGSIKTNSIALSVNGDFNYGNIDATSFNLNIGGNFTYNDTNNSFVLNSTDKLVAETVSIEAFSFANAGSITADSLALSIAGDFDYSSDFQNNGNIDVPNQYFTIRNGDFTNNTTITLAGGNLGITADNFINSDGSISANNFNVTAIDFYNQINSTINTENFNLTIEDNFDNYGTIKANNFYATTDYFLNNDNAIISTNNFHTLTNNFYNQNNAQIEIENNLNINANNNFRNNGAINSKKIDIQTKNFTNGGYLHDKFFVEQAGGSISGIDLAIKTEDSFYNNKNIMAVHSLNIAASNAFYNYSDGNISAPELAINHGGFYFNNGIITKGDDALPEIQPIPIIEKITEEELKDILQKELEEKRKKEEEEKEKRETELRQIEKEKKEKNRRIKELKRKKEKSKKIKNKKKRKIKKKIDGEKKEIRREADRKKRKLEKELEEVQKIRDEAIKFLTKIQDFDNDIKKLEKDIKDAENKLILGRKGIAILSGKTLETMIKINTEWERELEEYKSRKNKIQNKKWSLVASQAEKLIEKFQNVRSREEIADGLKNIDREIEEKENQLEKAENDKNKKLREKNKEQEEQIKQVDKETENEEKEITKEIAEKEKELIDAQKTLDEIEIADIPSPYGSDIRSIRDQLTDEELKIAETIIEKRADKILKNKDFKIDDSVLLLLHRSGNRQKNELKKFIIAELDKWKNSPNYQKELENNYKKLILESYFRGLTTKRLESYNAIIKLGDHYLAHSIELNLEKAKKDCKNEKENTHSIACQAKNLFREYNERYPNSATAKILTDTEEGSSTAEFEKNILEKYSKYNVDQFKKAYTKCKGYRFSIATESIREPLKDLTSSHQCNEFRELHIEQRKKWNEDGINYANQLIQTIKNKNSSATQEDIISEMRYKGFQLIPQEKTAFHCPQLGCRKLISLDGKLEIILDEHGKVVKNSEDKGTYNYIGDGYSGFNHLALDVNPYVDYGNDKNDTTNRDSRHEILKESAPSAIWDWWSKNGYKVLRKPAIGVVTSITASRTALAKLPALLVLLKANKLTKVPGFAARFVAEQTSGYGLEKAISEFEVYIATLIANGHLNRKADTFLSEI